LEGLLKMNKGQKHTLVIAVITFSVVVGLLVWVIWDDYNQNTKRCNAYCHCQEVGNCSYTFDYDKVKDCECWK
jgi:hypothetical protein